MNIIEKLKLQRELGGVLLFREGLFLRAYNESAYTLTQILGHDLKLKFYYAKGANQKLVVMCAFPYGKLSERLPTSVKTDFGYQLAGDFNTDGYVDWRERRCRAESEANAGAKAGTESLKTHEQPASALPLQTDRNLTHINLTLNHQQAAYLLTWQKGHYPIEVDLGFIESLQKQFSNKVAK